MGMCTYVRILLKMSIYHSTESHLSSSKIAANWIHVFSVKPNISFENIFTHLLTKKGRITVCNKDLHGHSQSLQIYNNFVKNINLKSTWYQKTAIGYNNVWEQMKEEPPLRFPPAPKTGFWYYNNPVSSCAIQKGLISFLFLH